MYFGNIESGGANIVVYELIANAIDLYLRRQATTIVVEVQDSYIRVSDDGPGFEFHKNDPADEASPVERFLTFNHNTPTADGHAPHIHILGGGLGLAILNAASEKLVVTSSNGESTWSQTFGKGKIRSPPIISKDTPNTSGTTISIKLDKDIFGSHEPNLLELRKVIFELAHLYPGLHINFNQERFFSSNGLTDYGFLLWKRDCTPNNAAHRMFGHRGIVGEIEYQVAAMGHEENCPVIYSWVNGMSTVENGTHVQGFMNALGNNGWNPQIALVHVVMHNPRYAGPCRDALRSKQVQELLESELTNPIASFLANEKV